jgi:hypothetical protein
VKRLILDKSAALGKVRLHSWLLLKTGDWPSGLHWMAGGFVEGLTGGAVSDMAIPQPNFGLNSVEAIEFESGGSQASPGMGGTGRIPTPAGVALVGRVTFKTQPVS